MDDALRNAAVFGGLALACAGLGWLPRVGGLASAVVTVVALTVAVILGVLDPLAPALWLSAWPPELLLLLAGWGLLGLGVRRLGGVAWAGPSLAGAFVGGAAFGALPVALGLTPGLRPARAARVVLAAVAGGLCGPMGSAPMVLLDGVGVRALLWPLGLALALVAAWPERRGDPAGPAAPAVPRWSPPRVLLVTSPGLWLAATLGSPALALALGLPLVWGLSLWRRPGSGLPGWGPTLRLASVLTCVLLLVPAGLLDFLALGLDDARVWLGGLLEPAFGLASLAVSALAGGPALALAGAMSACSDPAAFVPGVRAALVAGAAVGGLVPLVPLAGPGVVSAGLGRWALAALSLAAWLAWLAAG